MLLQLGEELGELVVFTSVLVSSMDPVLALLFSFVVFV
jgi:hypothetical protein